MLAFHDSDGIIVCASCAGVPARFACKRCGTEEQLTGSHCGTCRLTERARTLLSRPDHTLHPGLDSFLQHLLTVPDKRTATRWLRHPEISNTLQAMAHDLQDISHDTLDKLTPSPRIRYFRRILMNAGTLPVIDIELHDFTLHVEKVLSALPPAQALIIEQYYRWEILRALYRQAAQRPLRPSESYRRRQEIVVIQDFLTHLHEHGTTLQDVTQTDVDRYLGQASTTGNRLGGFVAWARRAGIAPALATPRKGPLTPRAAMSEAQRWAHVDRLLGDTALDTTVRLVGLFVLVFAQSLTSCARLKLADVTLTASATTIRFAAAPVKLPPSIAQILRCHLEQPAVRAIYRPAADVWLFDGLMPNTHITESNLGRMLKDIGIAPRPAKEAAARQLSSTMPARIVADTIGISLNTASRWAQESGATWRHYPHLR
ncbi:hypothetical protein MN0502_34100 (plasmid) [Arthrobacter sp. MN05-02]|nr:hypothetical protein MN0502_34100 [Arthrobacter sp. MN05-02]